MKKVLIWALTMGLVSALFGVQLGLIPGLILSWIISSAVDKNDKGKQNKKNTNNNIKCPKCQTLNEKGNEFCKNCGERIINEENVVDVEPTIAEKSHDNKENDETNEYAKTKYAREKTISSFKDTVSGKKDLKNDAILFCRNCGAKLNEGSDFCHKCGTKIK